MIRSHAARSFRTLLASLVVLSVPTIGTTAAAQSSRDAEVHIDRCDAAFDAAQRTADAGTEEGRAAIATALLRRAFEALEPAYPARRSGGSYDDPNAVWLRARGVLPDSWSEAHVDPTAWRRALARLQAPYGLDPLEPTGGDDPASLRADVEAALAAGATAIRPLALIGSEPGEGGSDRVAFGAVIWNWTPHARLLVFDVAGRSLPSAGAPDVLERLGTCAWTPRSWVQAPADVARSFYLGNVDTGVQILALGSDGMSGFVDVPAGEEESAFRLEHELLDGEPYAALGFTGPGPTLGTVLRLAVSVRTDLGLFDIGRYLAFP